MPGITVSPLEKDIERKVCDFAKQHHMLAYKFTSPQRASVPDRLFVTGQGHVFFIEFKRAGKRPTEAQWREINRLRATGVEVFVVDNVDEGKRIVGLKALGIRADEYTSNTGQPVPVPKESL